jgi:hypothetical protein
MNTIKLLVRSILEHPLQYKWTLQGLGMLRMYLSPEVRLHVWNSAFKVKNASPLHTHPWDFESLVVAGSVQQYRYEEFEGHVPGEYSEKYWKQTIKCGEGACTMTPKERVWLFKNKLETFVEGSTYTQEKNEIHESVPLDGTVTIVTRTFKGDKDTADVLWSPTMSDEFVSAEPRKADAGEVLIITKHALYTWFGEKAKIL